MKKYDFDEVIDRHGSGCLKYDLPEIGRDVIPLWIADMDFRTPDFILDALKKRLEHPVMGYPTVPEDYFPTISSWVRDIHGWSVDPSHIRFIPGIVKGMGMVLNCFFKPGDKVIIQDPVYHPFRIVPEKNGFEVLHNPLIPIEENGVLKRYRMDLEHLESIIDEKTRVIIISNPHNPGGVCWTRRELCALAEIAVRRGIMVISDEIHSEMVLWGKRHIPFASSCPEAASCSITFMSPSKTFNIAGIVSSYAIVLDARLREKFFNYIEANEFDFPNIFSSVATMAAYKNGADWRGQMLDYVQGNIDFVDLYLKENIPSVRCLKPQASFLVWLDCRGLGLEQPELMTLLSGKAGLYLNDGTIFGRGGEGFVRLNVGCPRSVLTEALRRLGKAIDEEK